MKRTLFYLATLLFMVLLSSCKDDENPGQEIISLPRIYINTENNAPVESKDVYLNATFSLEDGNAAHSVSPTATTIKGRGNSTWNFEKKPYRLKFNDKISLFGLTAAKDWVLLANYLDATLILNTVAFETARRLDVDYVNNSFHVELYMNGEYIGIYMVTEQVEINSGRVDIAEDDNSLFIEMDTMFDEAYVFSSDSINLPIMMKYPESDNGVANAKAIINELVSLLFAEDFTENWDKIRDIVDVEALARYIMVFEITDNFELIHPRSVYAYKNSIENSKLTFGPVWDFDVAFGYRFNPKVHFGKVDYMEYGKKNLDQPGDKPGHRFFNRFFHIPEFEKLYKEIWNENYSKFNFDHFIDNYVKNIREYAHKDFELYNQHPWVTYKNYDEAISELKDWLNKRASALNTQINAW